MDLNALKIDRTPSAYAKKRGGRGPWPWLFGTLLLGLSAGLSTGRLRIEAGSGPRAFALFEVPSQARSVAPPSGISANGHVVAARRAALSSESPARIVEMKVQEGDRVEAGELLARLHSLEAEALFERANARLEELAPQLIEVEAKVQALRAEAPGLSAQVEASRARIENQEAQLELAQKEHQRIQELLSKKVIQPRERDLSQESLERAQARRKEARADLLARKAELERLEARVQELEARSRVLQAQEPVLLAERAQAKAALEKLSVRAPFSGIVVLKDAEVGEVVSPNVAGGNSSRGAILTMVDPESLEVQVELPETSLAKVEVGRPVEVYLDAQPELAWEAEVSRIWPTANRQKATVEIRIRFRSRPKEAKVELRPEMGLRAVFLEESTASPEASKAPRWKLPPSALVPGRSPPGVFVFQKGRARYRPLELGIQTAQGWVVESGLEPQELVLLDPDPSLQDGDPVAREDG